MRDPHDILGVGRNASFDEIKAAYRQACKSKHPDMGGSHQEFVELQNAYEQILHDLKRGYQQQHEEARQSEQAGGRGAAEAHAERRWEKTYRDIDEELEELRRAAKAHEDALHAMRMKAWEVGEHAAWAKLTWRDLTRFIGGVARSGLKGLSLLFAALIGLGSILVEANVVSAIVLLGSGIGFVLSLALKSDKGGLMSAGLLLFGIMTIWLPPVRVALFLYPLATVSVLICLALIFKFAQQGGTVGLLTGGVLALYVLGVIVTDPQGPQQLAAAPPLSGEAPPKPASPVLQAPMPIVAAVPERPSAAPLKPVQLVPLPPPAPPEPRTLLASNGAVLKFVAGIPYRLKVRSGFTTSLYATQGRVALYSGDKQVHECVGTLLLPMHKGASPYQDINRTIRACGTDAIMRVGAVE